jgi:5,10-methylenetetrahydrofolate reductase
MVFGPCGGVRAGGRCEVDDRSCPFVVAPAPSWPGADRGPAPTSHADDDLVAAAPLVVCDIRPPEPTLASARTLADLHAGWCDAVLLGEHHDRVDLANTVLAPVVLDGGCRPWVTVTCRDRNAAAIESDLVALAACGVREVHCVTGDVRSPAVRSDAAPVFDLDGVRLAALAHRLGFTVSVAESPTVVPLDRRPVRAADKARAGASWCFVNLGPNAAEVDAFIRASRAAGSSMRHLVCIPVFTDSAGADRLAALPGVGLEPSVVEAVVHAPDPRAAGIARAVDAARAVLAVDGVDGVNLSGPASSDGPVERASVMRAVAEELRATTARSHRPDDAAPARRDRARIRL